MSFDARVDGTAAADWDALVAAAPAGVLAGDALLVIAPHPDDETLGAGGLIALFRERGLPVTVVLVTDGSPDGDHAVSERRSNEVDAALRVLGPGIEVVELGMRDGALREHRQELVGRLARLVAQASPSTMIVAPWAGDGHRDHRVVGEVVAEVAGRRRVWAYPIWMWHWGQPDRVAAAEWVAIDVDAERKARALAEFPSQTDGDDPTLRAGFLEHFRRPREIFFPNAGAPAHSLDARYFEEMYERNGDPWRYLTRWYERRKRAVTLASLTRDRYPTALEVGCSIGVLTDELADRCDDLLALDVSARAVAVARERLGARARVEQVGVGADLPPGPFALVVLSEIGYYLSDRAWESMVGQAAQSLAPDGELVLCHWRHPVADYPLTGDEVHERASGLGLTRLVRHEEDDFVLEVFAPDGRSVANREGFL